jgi:hypothetical protein
MEYNPVAKFIVPDWGDKVDSGIGLSYGAAKLHRLAGRYDNPLPESTIINPNFPNSESINLVTGLLRLLHWQSDSL